MSRPYLKKRPLHNVQECPACDGVGHIQDEDFDEHGRHLINVRCDVCDGAGKLVDCNDCLEPAPATEFELNSGYCGACAADRVRGDAEAERARVRRAS